MDNLEIFESAKTILWVIKMKSARYWIKKLNLLQHPEGGYYREIYRSAEKIRKDSLPVRFEGSRCFSTSIYYLLQGREVSYLHRIKSDEVWHFYQGSPLAIHLFRGDGSYLLLKLGNDFEKGQVFQAVVPSGTWFGAEVMNQDSYSLVGCSVAPGFDFADFELGQREELLALYPQHREIIEKLIKRIPAK